MSPEELYNEINDYAQNENLILGICDAKKLEIEPERLNEPVPFSSSQDSNEARTDPAVSLAGAKSVIAIGWPYYKILDSPIQDDILRGRMALISAGPDYHSEAKSKLEELAARLLCHKRFNYKIQVDTGPLMEKDFAVKAGLGFKGRNGLVISPRFGSFFAIGLMLLDIPLPISCERITINCGPCRRCVDACPTGALSSQGGTNWNKCTAFLTQSKELSWEQEALLNGWLYGCDLCQLACPYNQGLTGEKIYDAEALYPAIEPIIKMSKKELRRVYGDTSAGWRAGCVKRNAEVIRNTNSGCGLLETKC